MSLRKRVTQVIADEEGSVVTEYALLASGIALAVMATVILLGQTVYDLFYSKAMQLFQ